MTFTRIVSAGFLALICIVLMGASITPATYYLIENAGTPLTRRAVLNFSGSGVACTDNSGAGRTDCAISGGGGASSGAYQQTFTAQTSVTLTHNLNTTTIVVQCFGASGGKVTPNSTTITDANNVTVTFLIAQTGLCNVIGGGGGSAPSYQYTYISGAVSSGTAVPSPSGLSTPNVNNLVVNSPTAAASTGPGLAQMNAGGAVAQFQFRIPSTWDGSAITLDVDGVFAADIASGDGTFQAYSTPILPGQNTNVVTWSASSTPVTLTGGGTTFPSFPLSQWALQLPLTGLAAGQLIYIAIARPVDTFVGNLYIIGVNVGVKSGSSGGSITSGTFAALPAAGTSGRMYLFTDSMYQYALDNGTSWTYFINGKTFIPPTGFAWQNQSTATLDTTHGGELVLSGRGTGGANINGRFVAYPTPPFTRTLAVYATPLGIDGSGTGNVNGGLYISDGTAVETFCIYGLSSMQIQFGPSVTNITTNVITFPYYTGLLSPLVYLRYDDSVTAAGQRTFYYSWDGVVFSFLKQESNTASLTPTQIGFYVNAFDSGAQFRTWAVGWQ